MKIRLRHFNNGDCDFISQKLWLNTPQDKSAAMISEWNTLQYNGSYFEMFAIEADLKLTGYVSLYDMKENSIHIGAEIIPEFRQKGIAFEAITEVSRLAKEKGYNKAAARVLKSNIPSLKLCEKFGFIITGDDTTADGREVYNLEKIL